MEFNFCLDKMFLEFFSPEKHFEFIEKKRKRFSLDAGKCTKM